jgi:hypothetical protein
VGRASREAAARASKQSGGAGEQSDGAGKPEEERGGMGKQRREKRFTHGHLRFHTVFFAVCQPVKHTANDTRFGVCPARKAHGKDRN